MGKSSVRSVPILPLAAVLLAAIVLLGGCYPKGQTYGVSNDGGLVFNVNPPEAEVFLDGVGQGASSLFTQERYLKVPAGKHLPGAEVPGIRDVLEGDLRVEFPAADRGGADQAVNRKRCDGAGYFLPPHQFLRRSAITFSWPASDGS